MNELLKNIYKFFYFIYYDLKNGSKIKSLEVSPKANLGKNINIGKLSNIDSLTTIGSYTSIGKNTNITATKIGSYCSIANNVSIGQGEHDLNKISTKALFYDKSKNETLIVGECIIENDVWIGAHAIILRGVKIGSGAVIGAGAVVTKDVNNFEIVVGIPAKKLKYRFSEEKQKEILKSKWWTKTPQEARLIFKELDKI